MRFDDRLTTVLAGDVPTGAAAVAQYRQLVDILGQIASDEVDTRHAPALARIHALRASVSEDDRLLTVQCLSGRLISPVLVQYLAAEKPAVASAAIRAARLSDDQWAALVPALPTRARGFLRHRRDLGPRTRMLLDQLGLYDTALPDTARQAVPEVSRAAQTEAEPEADLDTAERVTIADPEPEPEPEPEREAIVMTGSVPAPLSGPLALAGYAPEPESQPVSAMPERGGPQSIGEIVKRIEALQEVRFKQAMEERPAPGDGWDRLDMAMRPPVADEHDPGPSMPALSPAPEGKAGPPDQFTLTTGIDGAIATVTGVPLGTVYGLSIAVPAAGGTRGVDASVATAFSRRMPIRGGRADLGSAAGLGGEWRIDADPQFDRTSGRFVGYLGIVRRPMAWESAGSADDDSALAGRDGLRQIVHELRTPLNAIMGFSEIIEQQIFGPVTAEYRDMAQRIQRDARQLLNGFDDLDTALRLDRNAIDDPEGTVPLSDLVGRLQMKVQPLLDHAGAHLAIGPLPEGAVIAMSTQALDRIVPRIVATLIGSCAPGETLRLTFAAQAGTVDLQISRPAALAGLDEEALLDVDRSDIAAGAGGPLLGLGFSLRLVRNLLANQGGRMRVLADALCLTLPGVRISADAALS